ncbi:MAG: response regulator [Bacteroidota bacterium]
MNSSSEGASDRLVMLVDDNSVDNFINQKLIELTGFSTNIVVEKSAKCALEYIEQNIDNLEKIPELLFLDLNMPVMDGFGFLDEFAKMPSDILNKCKIVVLTSSENDKDKTQIASYSNVIMFVSKPLSEGVVEKLKSTIS